MSIPRGFALLFADLTAGDWSWSAWSRRGVDGTSAITVLTADRYAVVIVAMWVDGSWSVGWVRCPGDPVPVAIGALRLRPIVRGDEPAPRWVRPNLNEPRAGSKVPRHDEGSPPGTEWRADIADRVQAGMDRLAHYGRTREWT